MNEGKFKIVDDGFFSIHGRYLNYAQKQILHRCYDDPTQNYVQMQEDLNFGDGVIGGYAAELWNLLADVFEEKVSKTKVQGAVDRYVNKIPSQNGIHNPPTPPKSFKIFISDRSQNKQSNTTEQLRRILQENGQETIIGEDWLQLPNEELNEYKGFFLIVSNHSAEESNIIIKEVQKAKKLRETRQDQTLAILLVHANSCMSLPLNHPLHQEIQGIPQLEWLASTESSTFLKEIIQCLEAKNKPQIPDDLALLIQNLLMLKISDNWMLTYVGENQLHKLGELIHNLKNHKILSGYAYWGVSPTRMWERACSDPAYHMLENLKQFPLNAKQLAQHVNKEQYNFVSLGVGEGSKDSNIIKDFFNQDDDSKPRKDFLYLPVDMSLDMLRVASEKIKELPSHRRIAIQRDIETREGMRQIAHIANVLGKDKPILYGFIGNTIANVEDPEQVLDNIVKVMKPKDLLLFEAQIIDDSALKNNQVQKTIQSVIKEYEAISFRQFALSALLQNSDLSVEPREKDSCYLVEGSLQSWKYGQFLRIDCWFKNNTNRELYLTFSNEDTTTLNLEEKISLYCSRKFTKTTLENFFQAVNLSILETSTYLSDKGTGFMVAMLQKKE